MFFFAVGQLYTYGNGNEGRHTVGQGCCILLHHQAEPLILRLQEKRDDTEHRKDEAFFLSFTKST